MCLVTRTVVLRLEGGGPQLEEAIQAYGDALNHISIYAFDNSSVSTSANRLQKALYDHVRRAFRLKSQMACSAFRKVAAAYRAARNVEVERPLTFRQGTMDLQVGRDWSFRDDGEVSINTLARRVKLGYQCSPTQRHMLGEPWRPGGSILSKRGQGRRRKYLLNVSVSTDLALPPVDLERSWIGLVIGGPHPAVAASLGRTKFFRVPGIDKRQERLSLRKRELRARRSRGAARRLAAMEQREAAYLRDVNHNISREVVAFALSHSTPGIAIGWAPGEDGGRRNTGKSRSEHQLLELISYKAAAEGIPIVVADGVWGLRCGVCGAVGERPTTSEQFYCETCGYCTHRERNGCLELVRQVLSGRQVLPEKGDGHFAPDALPARLSGRRPRSGGGVGKRKRPASGGGRL